jgi:hypothetical protein
MMYQRDFGGLENNTFKKKYIYSIIRYERKTTMSNWKACIPANPKYEGALNTFWVMNVSVVPHEAARIQVQVQYQNGALANEFITITGDEYKEWAADDNWIYQKVARKLALGVLADSLSATDASANHV